jgi:peptide/nickel transport system substrate-binding protein
MSRLNTTRRALLGGAGALALGSLARPAFAQKARASTLRYIPQADVTILDPLLTTAYPTRNHGHMCWDTLYGVDAGFVPRPQLAESHTIEDDGRRWTFVMRDGPVFHDGERILARDAVASIQRWMLRDTHGQSLAQRLDAIEVLDDRRFVIRLKRPFAALLDGLAKSSSYPCFVYPERFARIDPLRGFTEVVGSGPYRFLAQERVSGAQVVYERFDRYVPTPTGVPSLIAGPKIAGFARQEWKVITDGATAAAAIQTGELDWWEAVANDYEALLRKARSLTVERVDQGGVYAALRFNQLNPPFDDPAVRRSLLPGINQADFMQSVAGDDPSAWREGVGFFPVASPFASDAALSALKGPRDLPAAKAALAATGRAGSPVLALHATDIVTQSNIMAVAIDVMGKVGFKVDGAAMDFGTLVQRRTSKSPPSQGGWNVLIALFGGVDLMTPLSNLLLRSNGQNAWFGWPASPQIEQLREDWLDAPDLARQQQIARDLQARAFEDLPYIPLGQYFSSTGYRSELRRVRDGMVLPLNVTRG